MALLNMPNEITIPMNLTFEEFKSFIDAVNHIKESERVSHNREAFTRMYDEIIATIKKELTEQSPVREPDVPGTIIKTYTYGGDIDSMTFVLIQDEMTDEMKWVNTDTNGVWEWNKILNTVDVVNTAYKP